MRRKPGAIVIGVCILILSISAYCPAEDLAEKQRQLRAQIITYNLVNGLYLTDDQMEFILSEAQELESLRTRLEERKMSQLPRLVQTLSELRAQVKHEVPQVSEKVARRIHQNHELMLRLRKNYIDALAEATAQVKSILSENQIYLIGNFKPCLIPPKGPARIGQLSASGGPSQLLERIRYMPARTYEIRKYEIANRIIDKVSLKHSHLSAVELDQARAKLVRTMDDVRDLSDIEFALEKEERASEIKRNILSGEGREKEIDLDKRIARFLLGNHVVAVLEEKLSKTEEKK